jgi:hypothetical protein
MGRRLNRKDLGGAAPHFIEQRGDIPFEWNVYEEYELVNPDDPQHLKTPDSNSATHTDTSLIDLEDQRYLRTPDRNRIKNTYRPLIDTPHLFFEFARLAEQRDREEALKEWISRRGLLGFHKRERQWTEEEIEKEAGFPHAYRHHYGRNRDHWWTWYQGLTEYMHEGGPSERWTEVVGAANAANHTLRLWEAVLSGDPEQAEQEVVNCTMPPPENVIFEEPHLEEFYVKGREAYIDFLKMRASDLGLSYSEQLLHQAAFMACIEVQVVLEAFAFPYPAFDYRHSSKRQSSPPGPELVSGSWQPRNLLGAMYLQMYQLMISSGELRSCRYCGRIFSLAPPTPGSKERKPHSKKEFCDTRCRRNYHYHNVIKPNHNASRNGGNA